jgi:NADPH-dependent ferric siderophore reductase
MAETSERTQQPSRPRPRFRTLQVRRVEPLTPRMIRVTLAGDELEGFETPAPTQHLKLVIPEPGQDRPVLPDPSLPKGAVAPGQPRPLMRTYTIGRYDAASGELDIDFALHTDWPASTWAAQAKAGGVVAVAGPGGRRYEPDAAAARYLIGGDETAIPAIGALLSRLPAGMPKDVFVEIGDPSEELPGLEATWLHREAGARPGELLAQTLAGVRLEADSRAWIACEAGVMRAIRRHLLEGLDSDRIVTRGYWKHGEPNYRDGDYGED